MVQLKKPVDCFNEEKSQIVCRPRDEWAVMNLPVDEACQEARRVEVLVEKYGKELQNSDIDPVHISSFPNRVGAFIHSVAVMDSLVEMGEGNKERYQALKKEGYELRRKMLKKLDYLFRNDVNAQEALARIREGRGDSEVPRDCNALWEFCSNHKERIIRGHFDWSLAERANEIGLGMARLLAEIDVDPEKINASEVVVRQAWTHLWEAMSEIYEAGRYVFDETPEIEELFYIDYLQKVAKLRDRGSNVEEEPAADEIETASVE